jgi:hypothetical protein
MVMQVVAPDFVEIINVSQKLCVIRDNGLWERGGTLTLKPGQKTSVPLAVYHRICQHPWIMETGMFKAKKKAAAEAKKVAAAEARAEKEKEATGDSETVTEPEKETESDATE